MSQAQTNNVTRLPEEELPDAICTYDKKYLNHLFRRNGWREAARRLSGSHNYLSPSMMGFIHQVEQMKKRPSVKQLALLLSLDVNIGAQKLFAEMEKEDREAARKSGGANVVKLKSKR